MTRRLVVVGASHAGVAAAVAARDGGFHGEVVLLSAESRAPYQRPAVSKEALAGAAPAPLGVLDGIDVRLGARATGLDPARRVVATDQGEVGYDALVVATGAIPRRLPGIPEALTLRTHDDAALLRDALARAAHVAVVGAGFIGAEVASAARARGLAVTLLEAAPLPMAGLLGAELAGHVAALHEANGVRLRTGVQVSGVRRRGPALLGVQLRHGEVVPADVVVAALGVVPDAAWLAGTGIARHPDGSLRCDAQLRTSLPGVWAAGDVVRVGEAGCGHVLTAAAQGRVAGLNAAAAGAGERAQVWTPEPFAWSQWYGRRLQMAGVLHGAAEDTPLVRTVRVMQDGLLALAGDGDRLVGALGIDRPGQVAALRRRLGRPGSWHEALDLVEAAPGARPRAPVGAPGEAPVSAEVP